MYTIIIQNNVDDSIEAVGVFDEYSEAYDARAELQCQNDDPNNEIFVCRINQF